MRTAREPARRRGTSDIPLERAARTICACSASREHRGDAVEPGQRHVSSGYINNDIRLPQTGYNFQSFITLGAHGFVQIRPSLRSDRRGRVLTSADAGAEVTWRRNQHYINSATATWQARSWLTARSTVGLDYLAYTDEQNVLNGQGCRTCAAASGSAERLGKRLLQRWAQSKYSVDANATANLRVTNRIASKTSVGGQFNYDRLFGVLAEADILPPGALTLSAGSQKVLTEQTAETKTIGQYVEQQFGLDDRLFVVGAVRVDANSASPRFTLGGLPKVSAVVGDARRWSRLVQRSARSRGVRQSGQQPTPLAAVTFDSAVTASVLRPPTRPEPSSVRRAIEAQAGALERDRGGGADFGFLNKPHAVGLTVYDKTTKDASVNRNLRSRSCDADAHREHRNGEQQGHRGLVQRPRARPPTFGWTVCLELAGNKNR